VRVLIVHPLGLRFAGYPYIEEKVRALAPHGVEVAVAAPFKDETTMVDGRAPTFARIPLAFDRRGWMTRDVRRAITRFDPDVIHVWTPRALPSRIALEAMIATGAEIVVNYEDPEHLHFEEADGPFRSRAILAHLDQVNPTADDVGRLMRELPWDWVLASTRTPFGTPFLHPLFFGLLNQSAAGFTGIWQPWVDVLGRRFARPALRMPLAVDLSTLAAPSPDAVAAARASLGLGPSTLLLLRAGVLYAFVDDQTPMLEGYAAFLRTHPEARLVMCGHNYQEGRIAAVLNRLGIEGQVRWLGFLEASEYKALLTAADVALCPGYPDEYNRFRLAGKIVEYMIAGRAMICYASGIGEDLVDGRDALLLDPYTSEKVAEQLERATDPDLRRTLGANAAALAREWFDVVPLAGRLAAFYRTCLDQAAARAAAKPS
jgi:glycosyltransferase involved in cell wall biosynthesis